MRVIHAILPALALSAVQMPAQTAATNAPPAAVSPAPIEAEAEKTWAFSVSAATYFVPYEDVYVQPTLTADHGWLHLEGRYNYEALYTYSAWVGYNFSGGEKLAWEFTPMVGGIFGDTDGVAPGYKGSLSWRKLELYSEGEYVFNSASSEESFFYMWTELSLAPVDWFRFGFVTQRTRVHNSDLDVQPGFLVGFSYKKVDLTTYVFNPGRHDPTVVLAVGVNF